MPIVPNGSIRFINKLWILIVFLNCKRDTVLRRLHLVFAVLLERKKVKQLGRWVVFHGALK